VSGSVATDEGGSRCYGYDGFISESRSVSLHLTSLISEMRLNVSRATANRLS
jgi:hypothetical protein